jgi:hypothetical protein
MSRPIFPAAIVVAVSLLPRAGAIIFESTGDPTYNTTAPTGLLQDSGWQYLGNWNGFVGTPISPNHFITAAHVGGAVGNTFFDAGGSPHTATSVAIMNDLAIWTVTGSFVNFAPIYTGFMEGFYPMTVFGRGLGRGSPFLAGDGSQAGWFWGTGTSALRWGTNRFDYFYTDASLGQVLVADFNPAAGANEATIANGDSGGATFIQVGSQWQLAGILYGVEATFRTNATLGPAFTSLAVDDRQGLFNQNGSPTAVDPVTGDWGQRWIASRVSGNQLWVLSQIPEPSTYAAGVAVAALAAASWWRRRKG